MFAFRHLVCSHTEMSVHVRMTKSRNCLSPPCTANDEKINTGNGQTQLPAIRSASHTHKLLTASCTVKAAAVKWLQERE